MRTIFGLFVSALLVVGCAAATGSAAPAPSAAASASQSGSFGGSVQFKYDGQPTTTTVDAVSDGTSVSGTAVTEVGGKTHTVQLGCAAKVGDMWAVAGKTEKSDVEGGRAGDWSAVIVKPGSPAKIGIWVSDDPSTAADCKAWLTGIDFATLDDGLFDPAESGTLTPPTLPAS